jgi:AhpD family alkylhydroperoxidase
VRIITAKWDFFTPFWAHSAEDRNQWFDKLLIKQDAGQGDIHQTSEGGDKMKLINSTILASALFLSTTAVTAQQQPKFYADTYPEHALESRLKAEEVLIGADAKLDGKTRELIALGVAAQIPCAYCIYAHTKFARAHGASEAEIREAVAAAAHVRHWSTVLNGMGYDVGAFKTEIDAMQAKQAQ